MILIWVKSRNLDFMAVYFAKGCSLFSDNFLHLNRNILEAAHRLRILVYENFSQITFPSWSELVDSCCPLVYIFFRRTIQIQASTVLTTMRGTQNPIQLA